MLCPISKLLAKARAEGIIDLDGYDICTEPFFNTKLSVPAIYIPWKKEFWHKPVFRKTIESVEGPIKSDEPLTAKAFDDSLESHGKAAGLPDRVLTYVFRRGNLEILDSKSTLSVLPLTVFNIQQRTTGNRFETRSALPAQQHRIRGIMPTL